MKIETLVATINQEDFSLIYDMNIQTDVIVGNQCGKDSVEIEEYENGQIEYYNASVRGVGNNRNLLLDKASADICIFADDDMKFVNGYPSIVMSAFEKCPDADILVFNLIEKNPRRYVNKSIFRVNNRNYGKYGAARIAFRRKNIVESGVRFSLQFGGGTEHGSGEDTIFLHDCLKQNLKIYAVPYAIAEIDQDADSTWFEGYNRKFFNDKGALYSRLHPILWPAFVIRFATKYSTKYNNETTLSKAARYMFEGAMKYKKER